MARDLILALLCGLGAGLVFGVAKLPVPAPQVVWEVSKKSDCIALVALLDRAVLRSKKARDFSVWSEAVSLWADAPARGVDWTPIAVLREALMQVRRHPEEVLA